MRLERLETRRLLVSTGEDYSINPELDSSGLLGDVTAVIDWGDGTTSPAVVTGAPAPGTISVRLDYRFDTDGFFTPQRKQLLQIAADTIASRLTDQLAAIVPSANFDWTVVVQNPQTGEDVSLFNPTVSANEIVIFAGARDLQEPAGHQGPPMRGGGGTFVAPEIVPRTSGSCAGGTVEDPEACVNEFNALKDLIQSRGNPGALLPSPTDFAPYFGTIVLDSGETDWFDELEPSGIDPSAQVDFLTVVTHELAHAFGFGIAPAWDALTSTDRTRFWGSAAQEVHLGSGAVPLDRRPCPNDQSQVCDGVHWNVSVLNQHESIMIPVLSFSASGRELMSPLDYAGLDDIGWELNDPLRTVSAVHQYEQVGTFTPSVILTGSGAGQRVIELTPVTVDPSGPAALQVIDPAPQVVEGSTIGIELTVERINAPIDQPLEINVIGDGDGELVLPATITIPAGRSEYTFALVPIDDSDPERDRDFTFTFQAGGFASASVVVRLLDDEPPLFQNSSDRHDVVGGDGARASDALRIINELFRRQSDAVNGIIILDPESEQPNGAFLDVSGDYQLTALDALQVINELPNGDANGNRLAVLPLVSVGQSREDYVELDELFAAGQLF